MLREWPTSFGPTVRPSAANERGTYKSKHWLVQLGRTAAVEIRSRTTGLIVVPLPGALTVWLTCVPGGPRQVLAGGTGADYVVTRHWRFASEREEKALVVDWGELAGQTVPKAAVEFIFPHK